MGASLLFAALVFVGPSPAAGQTISAADSFRMMLAQSAPEVHRVALGGNAMGPAYRPGQALVLNPYAGVCFTMRTYKVKNTERLQDNFNGGFQEYSTCRMGSDFRIRTAVAPASK